jgi:hypothetical protein
MLGRFIEFTGFGNGKYQLSFNKMVTFTALWVFALAVWGTVFHLKQQPNVATWSFGLACVCAGFGLKGLMAYFSRRTENVSQNDKTEIKVDVADTVRALRSRDESQGFQPSGKVPRAHDD